MSGLIDLAVVILQLSEKEVFERVGIETHIWLIVGVFLLVLSLEITEMPDSPQSPISPCFVGYKCQCGR